MSSERKRIEKLIRKSARKKFKNTIRKKFDSDFSSNFAIELATNLRNIKRGVAIRATENVRENVGILTAERMLFGYNKQ